MRPPIWLDYFMDMARLAATRSKDRSTKVGCIIVGPDQEVRATGYNGFPRNINDDLPERHERPAKYSYTIHAEANAIAAAARVGTSLKGCTAYVTLPPCPQCAGLLHQAGIGAVVTPASASASGAGDAHARNLCELGAAILRECGVVLIEVSHVR